MSIETEVLIIGGGIVGASAALFLRRRGLPVILLDMGACGARASGVNYGGVRRQGRPLAQMLLTARAHELWGQLPGLIGTDGEYVRSGHLKLARTEQDLDELRAYRERTEGWGMDLHILPADALRRRFAWLDPGLAGGSFCPEDGHATRAWSLRPSPRPPRARARTCASNSAWSRRSPKTGASWCAPPRARRSAPASC